MPKKKAPKRKPKPKQPQKPATTPATAEPVDHVAALRLEADSRQAECLRRVNAALQELACELVAQPTFVDIGDGNHAVQCTFGIRAKVRG